MSPPRRSHGLIIKPGKGVVGTFPVPDGTRLDIPQPPTLPEGTIPFHLTPRADGLAVDTTPGAYIQRRWSPRRRRWPEVAAFDDRVQQLEQRQAATAEALVQLRERHQAAEQHDNDELAAWVASDHGPRPLVTAPAIARQIEELEREREAIDTAVRSELDEKLAYVVKHRGRLVSEAAKARAEAVTRLRAAIGALAEAREEAVAAVTCELWAVEYPGEKADPSAVPMQLVRGGRIIKAIPNYTAQLAMVSLLEALESDAAWLDKVAEVAVDEKQLDPNREAVWETSEEGREALDRRRQRDRKRLEQTMGPRTGWGDPDWRE